MKEDSFNKKYNRAAEYSNLAQDLIRKLAKEIAKENSNKLAIQILENLFPELQESDNEKIRKDVISFVEQAIDAGYGIISKERKEKWIAWLEKQGEKFQYWKPSEEQLEALDYAYNSCPDTERGNYYEGVLETLIDDLHKLSEKQGEQTPTDKVESKFKVGDWITFHGDNSFKILEIEPEQSGVLDYLLLNQNGHDSYYNKKYVDEHARLWTIQDAKDGDVLAYPDGSIVMFSHECNGSIGELFMAHVLYVDDHIEINNSCAVINVTPATKEQRDIFFQKMKEAGYEWDAEKKELKKISQEYPLDSNECCNPAWSEKDEKFVVDTVDFLYRTKNQYAQTVRIEQCIDWLKSLKERLKGE